MLFSTGEMLDLDTSIIAFQESGLSPCNEKLSSGRTEIGPKSMK